MAALLKVGHDLRFELEILLRVRVDSAWPSLLFSTMAVWVTRWSLLKTR
jgi:hypothetical protein